VAKRKLERFDENETFPFMVQAGHETVHKQDHPLKGKWHSEIFKNDNPIVLELGCGRGEYAVGMAEMFPEKNFIGVDVKGARLWYGAKAVQEKELTNVGFLRTRIDFIESFFAANEVSEIWITFPDPQPQKNRARKRLTGKMFTDRYVKILSPTGTVNLKTDNPPFFEFTLQEIETHGFHLLEKTADLYGEKESDLRPETQQLLTIQTYYEAIWRAKGLNIHFVKFQFRHDSH